MASSIADRRLLVMVLGFCPHQPSRSSTLSSTHIGLGPLNGSERCQPLPILVKYLPGDGVGCRVSSRRNSLHRRGCPRTVDAVPWTKRGGYPSLWEGNLLRAILRHQACFFFQGLDNDLRCPIVLKIFSFWL